jgi:hypothetical protein
MELKQWQWLTVIQLVAREEVLQQHNLAHIRHQLALPLLIRDGELANPTARKQDRFGPVVQVVVLVDLQ